MQDVTHFKEFLRSDPNARAFLSDSRAGAPVTLTRAPGRLDVMGGVADYSGSLVAEMTIAEAALVALAPRTDRLLRIWSRGVEAERFTPQVSLPLNDFYSGGTLLDYAAVHAALCGAPQTRWSAYLFGCVYVLLAEGVLPHFPHGANILLDSRVPLGAGVSSSAAIEVATMQALNAAYNLRLDGVSVARSAQQVENKVVGAPCGIMDQMTSSLGAQDSLLLILCQPHEVLGMQLLPNGVKVYGINSSVKHSVGGSAYARARVAAFMGRKLLNVDYLANFAPKMFIGATAKDDWSGIIPAEMLGAQFLEAAGETGDTVTQIDPETTYPVYEATAHAIQETDRVHHFVSLLNAENGDCVNFGRAGKLMYESHASYSRIGLGCAETNLLVELGCAAGPTKGIYGAKITGGGSGGTVAFLTCGEQAAQTIHEIAQAYQEQTGRTPQVFEGGLSPGAMAFGSERL